MSKRHIKVIGLVVVLLAAFLGLLSLLGGDKKNDAQMTRSDYAKTNQIENTGAVNDPDYIFWWEYEENLSPIPLEEWTSEYYKSYKADYYAPFAKEFFDNHITVKGTFPSDWDTEYLEQFLAITYNRFVNPVFGGWRRFQFADSAEFDINYRILFSDILSEEYVQRLAEHPEALGIYADWNKDNYNNNSSLVSSVARWFGSSDNITVEVNDDNTLTLTAGVLFTAWNQKDQTQPITTSGKLTIEIFHTESGHFLVSNSTMEMN